MWVAEPKPESWWHSPEYDAEFRRHRAQQRAWYRREETADPEDCAPAYFEVLRRYFSRETDIKPRRGDPLQALPGGSDLQALADTFGASSERLRQALELERRGLPAKAKRLLLCRLVGRRVNCSANPTHSFFRPYMDGGRYCPTCGPAWFREKFSGLLVSLEPVVERLLHEGKWGAALRGCGAMGSPICS